MMFEKLMGALLGAPAQEIVSYLKQKQQLKHDYKLAKMKSKIAAERAREERAKQADSNEHAWGMLLIQQSGWKDEFVLLVISVPLIMCFIPKMAPYVSDGFEALKNTPMWYQGIVVTVFLAVYGLRKYQQRPGKPDSLANN